MMKGTIFSLITNLFQGKRTRHSSETGIVPKAQEEIFALKAVNPAENLALLSRVYLPAENPKGLQPVFSVNEEGLMIAYMNLMKSDRILSIHHQYSSDPLKLLKAKSKSLSTKQIGEELFYVAGDSRTEELKNVYMIREDLLIQITAQGFSEAEFVNTLKGLIEINIDSKDVAPRSK